MARLTVVAGWSAVAVACVLAPVGSAGPAKPSTECKDCVVAPPFVLQPLHFKRPFPPGPSKPTSHEQDRETPSLPPEQTAASRRRGGRKGPR